MSNDKISKLTELVSRMKKDDLEKEEALALMDLVNHELKSLEKELVSINEK